MFYAGIARLLLQALVTFIRSVDESQQASPGWPLMFWTGWNQHQGFTIRVSLNQVRFRNAIRPQTFLSSSQAVLITGGDGAGGRQSAEIFHPDSESESFCYLRHFPEYRSLHTQDGSLKCGIETPRSCLTWNSDTGSWDLVTDSLTADRVNHISWTPADRSVTYLMGGLHSYKTSEVIDREGRVSASFPLKHRTE